MEMVFFVLYCKRQIKVDIKFFYVTLREQSKNTSTNKVAVVDTTGAGDSFAAGFLYGLSKNFTFEKCAAFGNVIAGEVLKFYGPRVEKSLKHVVMR